MSESYTHFLIPTSPQYGPGPDAVAAFAQGIVDKGNVPSPAKISFSRVVKEPGRVRAIRNMGTGQTINIPLPTRRLEQRQILSTASQIIEHAANLREYDVFISGEGFPTAPPSDVGYVEDYKWKPIVEPYHLEVRCCVRGNVVRLCILESVDDLTKPPDFTNYRPKFDEDCSAHQCEGIFVHPEVGAFKIPNAGCGMFWIEFRWGKWIFPRMKDETVNLLTESIVSLARNTFATDFVQACHWD